MLRPPGEKHLHLSDCCSLPVTFYGKYLATGSRQRSSQENGLKILSVETYR
jgi:hypothetical protein